MISRKNSLVVCAFSFALFFLILTGLAVAADLTKCEDLATDPRLADNPLIKEGTLTAVRVPESYPSTAYCKVEFTYSSRGGIKYGYAEGQDQQVKIRVGLPLNSVDGGTGGGVEGEGAWNGRTRGLGGGGFVGSVGPVTKATDAGYVGSSTDTGHSGSNEAIALIQDDPSGPYRLNTGLLKDFVVDSEVAQVRMSKVIAGIYYGKAPLYNYWDGCSTGGRQGLALAQYYPEELDGYLIGAPAVNYGRFRLAQIWGQLAMKDLVGGPISPAKLNQATQSAIDACDGNDGVEDGVITDPGSCGFSATANICGTPTAPSENCLTPEEAKAIDLIWDGPRNAKGKRVYHALSYDASLGFWNGKNPFPAAVSQLKWNHLDPNFDWTTVTMADYAEEAELGSNTNGDLLNCMDVKLDAVKNRGSKILMWQGTADGFIMVDNSLDYYTRVAAYFGHGTPDFEALKPWFRYFRAPGVGHCGGGDGPQPQDLFETMVSWVEDGIAPDQILAVSSDELGSRPLCPFPQKAIYDNIGDPDEAGSFYCGGDVQTKEAVCKGLVTKYKKETQNSLWTYGQYNAAACNPNSKVPLP